MKQAVASHFGLDPASLYLAHPTFFSRLTSVQAQTAHDEYWHVHVDKETYENFHYTSLLYLTDGGGVDFKGGEFVFVDGNDRMNRQVNEGQMDPYMTTVIHIQFLHRRKYTVYSRSGWKPPFMNSHRINSFFPRFVGRSNLVWGGFPPSPPGWRTSTTWKKSPKARGLRSPSASPAINRKFNLKHEEEKRTLFFFALYLSIGKKSLIQAGVSDQGKKEHLDVDLLTFSIDFSTFLVFV